MPEVQMFGVSWKHGVKLTDTKWNLSHEGITDSDCALIAQMLKLNPNLTELK